jgi:hypothetical protein
MKPYLTIAKDYHHLSRRHKLGYTRLTRHLIDHAGTFINHLVPELNDCSDMQETGI